MEYCGHVGRILEVNLNTREIRKKSLDLDLVDRFVGGWGINFKLAYDLMKPGTPPLSPENPIIIGVGPLVGTLSPGSSKVSVTTKFALPATEDDRHYVTTASSGSRQFGLMLKNTGYDHVVITGRAKTPVYLKIIDDDVEICDAGHLWGKKDIYETSDELSGKYGVCGVIAIGRAGENLIRFAMAATDKVNTLGRSGFGAVMGSKNLKAIVVQGTKGVRVSDQARLMKTVDTMYQNFQTNMKPHNDPVGLGAWPILVMPNFDPGVWSKDDWDALYGERKWHELNIQARACSSCWIACRPAAKVKDGEFTGVNMETGNFLWVQVVGQRLGLADFRQAMKLYDLANRAGVSHVASFKVKEPLMVEFTKIPLEEAKAMKRPTVRATVLEEYKKYVIAVGPNEAGRFTVASDQEGQMIRTRIKRSAAALGLDVRLKKVRNEILFWHENGASGFSVS
ncbi:aldehyde ferredoxin oxidoreductase N-terminal domain-containing protein [Chloroflexota bacterium]